MGVEIKRNENEKNRRRKFRIDFLVDRQKKSADGLLICNLKCALFIHFSYVQKILWKKIHLGKRRGAGIDVSSIVL